VRTETRYFITLPGSDIEVEALRGSVEESEVVWSEDPDGKLNICYAFPDPYGSDFEWEEGEIFRDFRSHRDDGPSLLREARELYHREYGPDRTFLVEVYSHGSESFHRVDAPAFLPDCQWDGSPCCLLVVPSDVTDPTGWADAMLRRYNAWLRGDVWAIESYAFVPGVGIDHETHELEWPIIGSEVMQEELSARATPAMVH